MINRDRICKLHKRIAKHDVEAIDEIETLEEAKEIIKMMKNNIMLNALTYQAMLRKIIQEIEEEKVIDRYKGYDDWFRSGVDSGLDDAKNVVGKYLNI